MQLKINHVKIIHACYIENLEDIKKKLYFESIIKDRYFERFVVLSKRGGVGTIEGIFDENFFALSLSLLK